MRVSTLFLLERVSPESVHGARLERLRTSLPFWLQMLAALLITWIISGPRWMKTDYTQTVVVIVDSSASMSAYRHETRAALDRTLGRWSQNAAKTRWHLLETDSSKPSLYAGSHLDELMTSLDRWQPLKGSHSPDEAYMVGRSLLKAGVGVIIHVTNHKLEVPSDIALLAIGTPKDNVGFSGLLAKQEDNRLKWRVLVTNHGANDQSREWWIERGQQEGVPVRSRISLKAGQSVSLEGELPTDVTAATLKLEPDGFTLDDTLPMLRPEDRPVRVDVRPRNASAEQFHKMIEAVPGVAFVSDSADITVAEVGTAVSTDAIFYDSAAPDDAKLDATIVVAENHAFTRDLNWTGLLTQKPTQLALLPADVPLLWKGDAILAFQRKTLNADGKPVRQLFLNWDVSRSNARRQPSMLVMLQRLIDSRRETLEGERTGNYETGESIPLPPGQGVRECVMNGKPERFLNHAPATPGFFEVTQGGKPLVHGACYFADSREANLANCESADTTEARRVETLLRETEADPLTSVWVLMVLGCLLGAWGSGGKAAAKRAPIIGYT